ncbi:MAG: ORF6N domain-containing protein [Elusimicrobia bacterium]|nr:ORF6N domain-containing protein [Elusimicrobiota bacterium]
MGRILRVEVLPIERRILMIRGRRVMLDSDLAEVYGVSTKRLNEQVSRNRRRFPSDFMFRLTLEEKSEVVAKCDHLTRLRFSPHRPMAFTENGVIMLASILNSPAAVRASVQVVRAFVLLRAMLADSKSLARRLDELEKRYDMQFKTVFDAIRALMARPPAPPRRIGFRP